MFALPEATPAVGVNVAVRVRPVPVMPLSVPPLTTRSLSVKLAPGSSLKVKVMVAVWPAFTAPTLLLMASVGGSVSMPIDGVVPAPPLLPAASV
jgi:hypothetical protein